MTWKGVKITLHPFRVKQFLAWFTLMQNVRQKLMCEWLYDLGDRRNGHGRKTQKERNLIQGCVIESTSEQVAAAQSHKNSEDLYELCPLEGWKRKTFIRRLLVQGGPWVLISLDFSVAYTLALSDYHWSSQDRKWDVKDTSRSEMLKVAPAPRWLPEACAELVASKR